VTILPLTILEAVAGLMILSWLAEMAYKGQASFVKTAFLTPVALFLFFIVFQLIPLPASLIRIISYNTAHLYETFIPVGISRNFFPLSIYPDATSSELFKFLTYAGVFFIIVNKIETRRQFNTIVNTIIALGFIISFFGIIQKYTYSDRVYWFDTPGSASSPFGPFANRNNFSGYINMVIPLTLGYFLTEMPLAKRLIYGFCLVIMSLGLFLSLSRAGLLIYIVVLAFILLFSTFKDSLKTKTKTFSIWSFLLFSLFIFFMEAKIAWARLLTLFQRETFVIFGHGYSWLDILRIWENFPVFGTGLGTFGSVSPMYKTSFAQSLYSYAHNDYLQLLSEVGLVGFILVALFFIFYFSSVLKMWFKRHDSYVVCLVLGGMGSVLSMLAYSFLDFNLQIPANGLLFFVIMGLVYRLVYMRFDDAEPISK
jgi:O-antigen ligase